MTLAGGCNGFFYYPMTGYLQTPERLHAAYEEVRIQSGDGTRLAGWYLPAKGAVRGSVLFFHGNGENMSTHYGAVYWLPDEGYNLLIFDYRGYGQSEGHPSRPGIREDGIAALNYLRNRPDTGKTPIVLYGQSLGSAVAVSTALNSDRDGIGAVILESAFTSYRKIAREKLGSFWLTWPLQWPLSFLVSDRDSPIDGIARLSPLPVLIVHGDADIIVPVHHAVDLYRAAKEPKKLWIVPGGRHIDAFTPRHPDFHRDLLAYLAETLRIAPDFAAP